VTSLYSDRQRYYVSSFAQAVGSEDHARRHSSRKRPDVSVGTANGWYVTAFTRENDVSRNAQTVFDCSCAKGLQTQDSRKERKYQMMGLLAKATQTRLFARVQNPVICGGLDFITKSAVFVYVSDIDFSFSNCS
jgi:hypothetical protein